jgi:DNA-binding NarL/FixJ family response regulator
LLTASGYAASVESPSRAHRCATPVTPSTRLAVSRSANRHAASCAQQGESSRRREPAARDQLTPQELQIAHLAAEGLSNREIGQQLYLSHRTIGTHLYRIFPKLGITARGELGAALSAGAPPPQP